MYNSWQMLTFSLTLHHHTHIVPTPGSLICLRVERIWKVGIKLMTVPVFILNNKLFSQAFVVKGFSGLFKKYFRHSEKYEGEWLLFEMLTFWHSCCM